MFKPKGSETTPKPRIELYLASVGDRLRLMASSQKKLYWLLEISKEGIHLANGMDPEIMDNALAMTDTNTGHRHRLKVFRETGKECSPVS